MNARLRISASQWLSLVSGLLLSGALSAPLSAVEPFENPCDRFRAGSMDDAPLEQRLGIEDEAELTREARDRLRSIARFRGLPDTGPVTVRFKDREWFAAYLRKKFSSDFHSGRRSGYQAALVWWGLLAPGLEGLESQARAWAKDMRGLYDPELDTLLLADWVSPEQLDATLTHELIHVLQERVFGLSSTPAYESCGEEDRKMALECLREGEAVALTAAYHASRGDEAEGKKAEDLEKWFQERRLLENARRRAVGCSERLTEFGDFPYQQGAVFVQKTAWRDGWSALDRLWRDPPQSTDEILHPERRRESPRVPALPVLQDGLFRGATRYEEGTLGSCGWILTLSPWLGEGEARRDVEGWRGDRLGFWSGPGGWRGLAGRVIFHDANAARRFGEGLRETQVKRWRGGRELSDGIRQGAGASKTLGCAWVGRVGREVRWAEGFDAARTRVVQDRFRRLTEP